MPQRIHVEDPDAEPHAELFADPKVVRLSLAAGEGVPAHSHPDTDVLFYQVEGRLDLRLDDETYELAAGDAVTFAGEADVEPTAVADSTALVAFFERADRA